MFVFAVLIYVRVNHGLPAKMELEISANSAAWKLNQYMLFSLTHTQTLYMFNSPTMECTKDKQLAMDPHRNRGKMSETVGTWTHGGPAASERGGKEAGQTDPGGKNIRLDISGSSDTECSRHQAVTVQKSTQSTHGKGHTCTYTGAVHAPHILLIHGLPTWPAVN